MRELSDQTPEERQAMADLAAAAAKVLALEKARHLREKSERSSKQKTEAVNA
jgi:hypothetical protein